VVDDELRSQEAIRRTLEEDFRVLTAGSAEQASALLEREPVAVLLCDQRMPGTSGVAFLRQVRQRWPEVVRIIVSGYSESADIVAGINEAGIYQYILKPWAPEHLLDSVRNAVEAQALQRQTARLDLELRTSTPALRQRVSQRQQQVQQVYGFERIVRAAGSPLDGVCALAAKVARYDLPVLENCAAITDTLLESELFGHKRGAFTGAYEDHVGLFQRAHGGTVLLDEIGETSAAFQVKLLRVLQEGEVRPVGAARPLPVDVRVLAATHRELEQRVRDGLFREDLYYRLAAVTLTMPPLRERVADIGPIAQQLLHQVAAELRRPAPELPDGTLACLLAYPWPGNIRELRNEIARALALHDGARLPPEVFSPRVLQGHGTGSAAAQLATLVPSSGTLVQRLEVIEAMLLRETLLRQRWNKTRAAQELGLSRVGLRSKIQRFGLEPGA